MSEMVNKKTHNLAWTTKFVFCFFFGIMLLLPDLTPTSSDQNTHTVMAECQARQHLQPTPFFLINVWCHKLENVFFSHQLLEMPSTQHCERTQSISRRSFAFLPFSEFQNLITSNERKMADLKTLSLQLQQRCSAPCTDTVEIQSITGTGRKEMVMNKGLKLSLFVLRKRFVNPAPSEHLPLFSIWFDKNRFGAK